MKSERSRKIKNFCHRMTCEHHTRGEVGEDYNSEDYDKQCICCGIGIDEKEDFQDQCVVCEESFCGICAQQSMEVFDCCGTVCEGCQEIGVACQECDKDGCPRCLTMSCYQCKRDENNKKLVCKDCTVPCYRCQNRICISHQYPTDCETCCSRVYTCDACREVAD